MIVPKTVGGADPPGGAATQGSCVRELQRVAHLHHEQGRTNIEIAEEMGISRLSIPALLRQAEAEGTVSYLIKPPAGLDADRSDRVREKYSLAEALIPTSTLSTAVAALTARYLRELLVGGAVVGVSWGELVARVVRELEARGPLPQCDIVQLLGGTTSLQSSLHATELVGRLSVLTGGAAYALHAPLVLPDVITADGLRREESIARTLEASRALTFCSDIRLARGGRSKV